MRTKHIIGLTLSALMLVAATGCSSLRTSDSAALQGTWRGTEPGRAGLCSLDISGNKLHFRGQDDREWYKGTFSLREDTEPRQVLATVEDCPAPQYVGKPVHAIYRLEGNKLTLSGNEPGTPSAPASFAAPGSRTFEMTKEGK